MNPTASWRRQLDRWLEPFLDVLGDKRRRVWAPLYVLGLLIPGERKSTQPISLKVAPQDVEQIHHANCQCAVSLTLARDEVPIPIALRLFLREGVDG